MNEPQVILSPAGEQKRRAILDLAFAAADQRRRTRYVARGGALVLIASLLVLPVFLRQRAAPPVVVKSGTTPAPPPQDPLAGAVLIPTDPTITQRLSIRPQASTVVIIHDDELLAGLAQAHKPAGLAYVNGKATLLFR